MSLVNDASILLERLDLMLQKVKLLILHCLLVVDETVLWKIHLTS